MAKAKVKTASIGHITAQGATVSEAKANLAPMAERACSLPSAILESRFGLVLFAIPTPTGWNIGVFDPLSLCNGEKPYMGNYYGPIDSEAALESARMHAAQSGWNHNSDDSAHIEASGLSRNGATDLARWIRFQREYIKLSASGLNLSDGEKHRLACEASWQPVAAEA